MLFYKENKDPKKAAALRQMVEYCLTEGQKASAGMGYIPLPETVVAAVRKASGEHPVMRMPAARAMSFVSILGVEPALRKGSVSAPPVELGLLRRSRVPRPGPSRRLADPAAPRLHPLVHRRQSVGRHAGARTRAS